ncbi:MAG: AAA family ATPase, partial [Deltaproteobacteria bacterium]|nr:AAA family ATPase [Deltaproteobacteria bacterium]
MRILAVGWENLASLGEGPTPLEPGGERLLWLSKPPLSQVGVFAITGPTGSGKTTILDAICLSLFDATPRLGRSGGVRVGRSAEEAELAAFDTRNL